MIIEMTTEDLGRCGSITLPIDAGYPGREYTTPDKTWLYIKKQGNKHLLTDNKNELINNVEIS